MTDKDIQKIISAQALGMLRSANIDGLVDAPSLPEVTIAIDLAIGEINITSPITRLSLQDMWGNSSYQYLLTLGTIKYLVLTLFNDWVHNGLDATVDQFTINNRMSDYSSLLDRYTVEFTDRLVTAKPMLSRHTKTTQIYTPKVSPRRTPNDGLNVYSLPRIAFVIK